MAGESNFPKSLDTDTELYRVSAPDVVIPAHHNNVVDALESIEGAIGTIGDGSENGGVAGYNMGLAHYVGFQSVKAPNVRYPWLPVDANAWYGSSRATPAGWTLAGGVAVAYNRPEGVARLVMPDAANALVASCNAIAGDDKFALVRIATACLMAAQRSVRLGWSAAGDGSDIDGVALGQSFPGVYQLDFLTNGAVISTIATAAFGPYVWLLLLDDGALHGVNWSLDGQLWAQTDLGDDSTGAPTKFVIMSATAQAVNNAVWLDFVAFGSTAPASTASIQA